MANKNKTPLLRPLRLNGGTLYIFPSASEDIGLNLNSRATGVALSHYALLNLPASLGTAGTNTFKPTSFTGSTANDFNNAIAEDLLNYVMNFETILMNQDDYNYQLYQTVSERVFWHWLKDKLGTVKLSKLSKPSITVGNDIYEEPRNANNNRVVQCFGAIDAGNSLSTEFGIFNETYINIPTSYGAGPVFFKKSLNSDGNNIINSKEYTTTSTDSGAYNVLEGRNIDNANTLKILNSVVPIYDDNTKHCYSSTDYFEIVKDIPVIQTILEDEVNPNIVITGFDDINIDSAYNYEGTNTGDSDSYTTSKEYSDGTSYIANRYDITSDATASTFEFNAILLYYSIYDLDNPDNDALAVNLFGIIFLNGGIVSGSGKSLSVHLESLTKKKSLGKSVSNGNQSNYFGNSYSFRVNIKTMSIYDNTDAMIQDNTTLSSITSNDFSDVISNLNRAIDVMNTNMNTTAAILNKYASILAYYDDLKENIKDLSTLINAYVRGEKVGHLDTSTLYVNNIKANTDKGLDFYILDGTVEGIMTYTSPIKLYKSDLLSTAGLYYKADSSIDYVQKHHLSIIENSPSQYNMENSAINQLINDISINFYKINDTYNSIVPEVIVGSAWPDSLRYLTTTDSSGNTYIDYIRLIPYLIQEIKYLKETINTQHSGLFSASAPSEALYAASVPMLLSATEETTDTSVVKKTRKRKSKTDTSI